MVTLHKNSDGAGGFKWQAMHFGFMVTREFEGLTLSLRGAYHTILPTRRPSSSAHLPAAGRSGFRQSLGKSTDRERLERKERGNELLDTLLAILSDGRSDVIPSEQLTESDSDILQDDFAAADGTALVSVLDPGHVRYPV